MTTLVFGEVSSRELQQRLLQESPNEAAAILICGVSEGSNGLRLLVRSVTFFERDHYVEQRGDHIVITPTALAPQIAVARNERLSLVLVHTHPFSEGSLAFSAVDDAGELTLLPSIFARATTGPHGALVLGRTGFEGRVRDITMSATKIDVIEDVSRTVDKLVHAGADAQQTNVDRARNDRSIRALGPEGHQRLAAASVAVVGCGGTGSIVAEHLAYLGVGNVKLIDFDSVDESNLNRLVGALPKDTGRNKSAVIGERVRSISPRTNVEYLVGDVVFERFARELLDCDVVFCCTDSHGSRAVMNQIAYQYYIATIDLGLRIDSGRDGAVTSMGGRVQLLSPGLPCLLCSGLLDPEQIRRDFMTPEERRADPYIVGSSQPQPAVVTLNGVIGSLATTMFLSVLAGFPGESRYQNYVIDRGIVRSVTGARNPSCIVCSVRGAVGRGDRWSPPWRPA